MSVSKRPPKIILRVNSLPSIRSASSTHTEPLPTPEFTVSPSSSAILQNTAKSTLPNHLSSVKASKSCQSAVADDAAGSVLNSTRTIKKSKLADEIANIVSTSKPENDNCLEIGVSEHGAQIVTPSDSTSCTDVDTTDDEDEEDDAENDAAFPDGSVDKVKYVESIKVQMQVLRDRIDAEQALAAKKRSRIPPIIIRPAPSAAKEVSEKRSLRSQPRDPKEEEGIYKEILKISEISYLPCPAFPKDHPIYVIEDTVLSAAKGTKRSADGRLIEAPIMTLEPGLPDLFPEYSKFTTDVPESLHPDALRYERKAQEEEREIERRAREAAAQPFTKFEWSRSTISKSSKYKEDPLADEIFEDVHEKRRIKEKRELELYNSSVQKKFNQLKVHLKSLERIKRQWVEAKQEDEDTLKEQRERYIQFINLELEKQRRFNEGLEKLNQLRAEKEEEDEESDDEEDSDQESNASTTSEEEEEDDADNLHLSRPAKRQRTRVTKRSSTSQLKSSSRQASNRQSTPGGGPKETPVKKEPVFKSFFATPASSKQAIDYYEGKLGRVLRHPKAFGLDLPKGLFEGEKEFSLPEEIISSGRAFRAAQTSDQSSA